MTAPRTPQQRSEPRSEPVAVRAMTDRDWPALRAIYEAGIATGNATFETTAPSWDRWDATHLPDHRLVAVTTGGTGSPNGPGGQVVGWAALAPVSDRCAYAGVAENSVYVDPAHHGRGIGRTLLLALLQHAEAAGRCGFRTVGRRERLGRLHGIWRDVLLLERRSPTIT